MNKFGMVLGVAAVATLAGCKDPDYKYENAPASQNEVKTVEAAPATITPIETVQTPTCKCPPGTKHTAPCTCGAPDCKCVVEPKKVITADVSKPAAAVAGAETTTYIVQRGDSLSKISKKFNITIAAIRKANPKIKNDVVMIGQKLTLPGKVDVGVQKAPVVAVAKPTKKVYTPYAGATKEYVVKSGDTLGAIAYGNGLNIRQLKELNGLTSDSLKIGQKLKVPADGKALKQAAAAAKEKAAAPKAEAKAPAKAETKAPAAEAKPAEAPKAAPAPEAPKADAAAEAPKAEPVVEAPKADAEAPKADAAATTTYVVQEGDDLTGVAIRWGVTTATIRDLNNLSADAQLVPGQIIKLPADAQQ